MLKKKEKISKLHLKTKSYNEAVLFSGGLFTK